MKRFTKWLFGVEWNLETTVLETSQMVGWTLLFAAILINVSTFLY